MRQDARTHAMSLIPPRGTILPAITTIQAALSCFDSEARLVVQAAPPFRVVHANRSFRLFITTIAGEEPEGQLLAAFVGRPLERLVDVTNPSRSTKIQPTMDGVITLRGETRKACQVRLYPVAEQQHHQQHHTFERSISHFVVSFSDAVIDTGAAATTESSSSDSDANESYTNHSTSGPVIGTVG
jgi:hypothetical protein